MAVAQAAAFHRALPLNATYDDLAAWVQRELGAVWPAGKPSMTDRALDEAAGWGRAVGRRRILEGVALRAGSGAVNWKYLSLLPPLLPGPRLRPPGRQERRVPMSRRTRPEPGASLGAPRREHGERARGRLVRGRGGARGRDLRRRREVDQVSRRRRRPLRWTTPARRRPRARRA